MTKDKGKLFKVDVASELQVHLKQLPFYVSDIQKRSAFSTQIHVSVRKVSGWSDGNRVMEEDGGCRVRCLPLQVRAFITLEKTNV